MDARQRETTTPRQAADRQRALRQWLRGVDEALLRYGPRRALAQLARVQLTMPRGSAAEVRQYQQVLERILERKRLEVEDHEAALWPG